MVAGARLAGVSLLLAVASCGDATVPNSSLALSRSDLAFRDTLLTEPSAAHQVIISSNGHEAASWTATSPANWIRFAPTSGITPSEVEISVDVSDLTAGSYQDSMIFDGSNLRAVLTVSLELAPANAADVQGVWHARSWNDESLPIYAGRGFFPYEDTVHWDKFVDSVSLSIGGEQEIPGRYSLRYIYRIIPQDPKIPGDTTGGSGDAGLYEYANSNMVFTPLNTGKTFELRSATVLGGGLRVDGAFRKSGESERTDVTWFFVRDSVLNPTVRSTP